MTAKEPAIKPLSQIQSELDKAMDGVRLEIGKKLIPVFQEIFADLHLFLEREKERRRNEKIVMAGSVMLAFLLAMIYWYQML